MRDRHTAAGSPHLVMSMKPPVMVPFLLYWSPLMVTQLRWRALRVTLPAVSRSLHTMILPKICRPAGFQNNEEQKAGSCAWCASSPPRGPKDAVWPRQVPQGAELAADGDAYSRGHMWGACLGDCLLVLLSTVDLVDQWQRIIAKVWVLHRLWVDAVQRYECHAPGFLGREQRCDARRHVIIIHHHMEQLIAGRHLNRTHSNCQCHIEELLRRHHDERRMARHCTD